VRIVNAEHVHCRLDDFVQDENKFLIDSCANMNIIKMSVLKYYITVNEKEKESIKGTITATILTVRPVMVKFFIKNQTFFVKFDNSPTS